MHILLYVPDNQVTENFMPQLWPFILQRRTPEEHRVTIMDGNVTRHTPGQVADFVVKEQVGLVGIGFMTRMAQKAYRVADAIREVSTVPIVMGGPHVTAEPDEPLGEGGGPRHADAVVLGEADQVWPRVVEDAAAGRLQPRYGDTLPEGPADHPSLDTYPVIHWDRMDLSPFDLMRFVPSTVKRLLQRLKIPIERLYIFPVESGRGCPYGCEFCSVTGFFGGRPRFRTAENVVEELLLIQSVAKRDGAQAVVFLVDDNFAIDRERAKSLLREMIQRGIDLPWCAQISVNLLKDEEMVDLIVKAGGRLIFIGLESVEAESLGSARKSFNRPSEYAAVLEKMARKGLTAITSFIYGLDADRPGCSRRVLNAIESWPPVMPVFCLLTPLPGTPLYRRLAEEGRLTRPKHWLDFQANKAAFTPRHLTQDQVEKELLHSWKRSYRAAAFARTQRWLRRNGRPFEQQATLFVFRLIFRGIYFPQKSLWSWVRLLGRNTFTLSTLVLQASARLRKRKKAARRKEGSQA
ncbi:MAG: B12-binding domain-containing radical SAM protein [Acidobacteria bacterium]|nr:B12-binding domain-containing radical SAM protein [Acidobacteriota bacterium]